MSCRVSAAPQRAATSISCRSSRASGRSPSRSRRSMTLVRMTVRILLKSWAMPPASRPNARQPLSLDQLLLDRSGVTHGSAPPPGGSTLPAAPPRAPCRTSLRRRDPARALAGCGSWQPVQSSTRGPLPASTRPACSTCSSAMPLPSASSVSVITRSGASDRHHPHRFGHAADHTHHDQLRHNLQTFQEPGRQRRRLLDDQHPHDLSRSRTSRPRGERRRPLR